MKKILLVSTVLLGFSFSQGAYACAKKKVVQTQKVQKLRINQGIKSGELTKAEARRLKRNHRAIVRMKKAAKRDDGRIDQNERRRIKKAQAKLSKKIYIKKHNLRSKNS